MRLLKPCVANSRDSRAPTADVQQFQDLQPRDVFAALAPSQFIAPLALERDHRSNKAEDRAS
jgi:hypothetical protein